MNSPLSAASLILSFLPLLTFSCPVEFFSCQGNYHNTDVIRCGTHLVQCKNSVLKVQFLGRGHWYETRNITFPEKTFKVLDPWLGSRLQHQDCHFLYNFTNPIHGFYPSTENVQLFSNHTLFNCNTNSYDFSRDLFEMRYGCSHCLGYDLYYTKNPGRQRFKSFHNCSSSTTNESLVEWKLSFTEKKEGIDTDVEFSLLSLAFTHGRLASPRCFACVLNKGNCRAVASASSSDCSCNLECRIGRGLNMKKKVIIGVCSLLVGFVLALIVVYIWLRRRQGKVPGSFSRNLLVRSTSVDLPSMEKDPEAQDGSYIYTPIFTYEELEFATGGFNSSRELGDGGFGVVYKGTLKDGRVVAVKRLHERNYRRVQQFRNEVEILNRIRHPNLVSLYGCTTRDSRELLLVYEYVSNGTVADHLHGSRAGEHLLTWPLRLSIAFECAAALAYLHASEPQIIHRDVKTSNILLDNEFHVKVADFGLSRQFPTMMATHISTAPQGTPGYVDPEYHQFYQLTDKSDVYSFGVVLVELISSMPAVDMERPRSEINLSNLAMSKISRGQIQEIIDPTLGFDTDLEVRQSIETVAELAFRCLQPEKDMRPSMDEVRDALDLMLGGNRMMSPIEEKHVSDDTSLLKSSGIILSPDTVVGKWASKFTTPNTSS